MNRRHFLKLMAGGIAATAVPMNLVADDIIKGTRRVVNPPVVDKAKILTTVENLEKGDYAYSLYVQLLGESKWVRQIQYLTVKTNGDSLLIENAYDNGTHIYGAKLELLKQPMTNLVPDSTHCFKNGGIAYDNNALGPAGEKGAYYVT